MAKYFAGARVARAAPLAGGVSADVYRLDLRWPGGRAASVVLRAHGTSHVGHSAPLEFALLRALHRAGLPVPEPLHVDVGGDVLAEPFVVMAYVEGSSDLPAGREDDRIDAMAAMLARIHAAPVGELPELPTRNNALPELFDYLPNAAEWHSLRGRLSTLHDTQYAGAPTLLHGDFWPENVLWRGGEIAAVLDWEDAALGDPLSDVACARLELRYKFGKRGALRFTQAYARHRRIDAQRLALWDVFVAAAAQHFMGEWGLAAAREAHMRGQALASIREAGARLGG